MIVAWPPHGNNRWFAILNNEMEVVDEPRPCSQAQTPIHLATAMGYLYAVQSLPDLQVYLP